MGVQSSRTLCGEAVVAVVESADLWNHDERIPVVEIRRSRSRQGLDDQPRATDGDSVFNQSGWRILLECCG